MMEAEHITTAQRPQCPVIGTFIQQAEICEELAQRKVAGTP
jgi:hypothetical protein